MRVSIGDANLASDSGKCWSSGLAQWLQFAPVGKGGGTSSQVPGPSCKGESQGEKRKRKLLAGGPGLENVATGSLAHSVVPLQVPFLNSLFPSVRDSRFTCRFLHDVQGPNGAADAGYHDMLLFCDWRPSGHVSSLHFTGVWFGRTRLVPTYGQRKLRVARLRLFLIAQQAHRAVKDAGSKMPEGARWRTGRMAPLHDMSPTHQTGRLKKNRQTQLRLLGTPNAELLELLLIAASSQ